MFEREFDYTVTISESDEQPINGAMHFVPKGKYREVGSQGLLADSLQHFLPSVKQHLLPVICTWSQLAVLACWLQMY